VPQEQNGAQKLSIRGQHSRLRLHPKDNTSPSPLRSVGSGASTPVEAAEDGDQRQQSSTTMTTTTMTTKRLKVADEEKPSLLLRMGAAHQRRSSGGRSRQGLKPKSPPAQQQQQRSDLPAPAGTPDLSIGISIKGAARTRSHPHSLLERIQGEGT